SRRLPSPRDATSVPARRPGRRRWSTTHAAGSPQRRGGSVGPWSASRAPDPSGGRHRRTACGPRKRGRRWRHRLAGTDRESWSWHTAGCRGGRGRHWLLARRQRDAIEAELLEEPGQGDAGDTHAKGGVDEVDQVSAASVGVGEKKLSDGPGITRQQLAVRPSVHAMMGLADGLLGGESLLTRSRGTAKSQEAGDGSDRKTTVTVQEEVTEQSRRVIVGALGLAEAEDRLQERVLLGSEASLRDLSPGKPAGKGLGEIRHRRLSGRWPENSLRRSGRKLTEMARNPVRCWWARRKVNIRHLSASDVDLANDQDWVCPICGEELINGEALQRHHIIARADGGSDARGNRVLVHLYCHQQETTAWRKRRRMSRKES